jgi:hypothetical protein
LTFLAIVTLIAKAIVGAKYKDEKVILPTTFESEPTL